MENLKQLHELKHIVAVWNFKPHESAPVQIIEDDGKFYISVFDYVTGKPISLKRQRGYGERPFASLNTAYKAIRTDLDWQGKISLIKFINDPMTGALQPVSQVKA